MEDLRSSVDQSAAVSGGWLKRSAALLLPLGAVVALVGYFLPWLPHKAAGLTLVGIEMGEWARLLPAIQAGHVRASVMLFYLPPVATGFMLALWSWNWPNRRFKSWLSRGLAVLVALLALPSWDAFNFWPREQWIGRVYLIAFVAATAVVIGPLASIVLSRVGRGRGRQRLVALLVTAAIAAAFIGGVVPAWAYYELRPAISQLYNDTIGFGIGIWLNGIGQAIMAVGAIGWLRE